MLDALCFRHVDVWIFDLDNTLYPPEAALFAQIDQRMIAFIAEALSVETAEADRLRQLYWKSHGATLAGLMDVHGVDPDAFLHATHDIDLSSLAPDDALSGALAALPGRKIVHTNGPRRHAERVLGALAVADAFDAVFALEDCALTPKPAEASYSAVIDGGAVEPTRAAMIEDTAHNLAHPHALGMRTILIEPSDHPDQAARPHDDDHVHMAASDLAACLGALTRQRGA